MRLFLFLALLGSILPSFSQMPQLQATVDALDKDPVMRSAVWSLSVRDAKSGKLLLGKNAEKCLVTASTMKAVTSATALAVLGPDFQFKTVLEYDGKINTAGTLEGNLYIRGTGDPTLGSDRFGKAFQMEDILNSWTEVIKTLGIKEIQGKVIGDASHYSTQLTPGNWNWEDMGNYYGAGASGLNVFENLYTLYMKPGSREGTAAQIVRTYPPIEGLTFVNELSTGAPGSGDNAYIYGAPYTLERYVRGTIPAGPSSFKIKGSIPEPDLLCAKLLLDALVNCEIATAGGHSSMREELRTHTLSQLNRTRIHTHLSPTLSEILTPLNQKSINLYAECLLKAIGKKSKKDGSTAEGVDALLTYWQGQGITSKWQYVRDGSGLSANNAMSTSFMTQVLAKSWQSPVGSVLKKSFPLAGRSGSLKGMLKGTAAEGRLYAKSGYISGVRAYTGYVTTADGRELCFAMMANQYACGAGTMRRKFEKIMARIASGK